ncbi:hypothetical protein [Breznakia pachnodae]|uniref:Uncharacterized protein n=1 Tax=Breznakia pachnodae TaxID=265178 RepID=A0ABU0E4W3_9FIRM|nr:hypothetical protein [Breznakia pachnodae]MDQ0361856.1 hypothetical protein [Breznakia pachnodae]
MKTKTYKIILISLLIGVIGTSVAVAKNNISAADTIEAIAPGNWDEHTNGNVVGANEEITMQTYSTVIATYENSVSYTTSGTYSTISENLNNGFDVTITGGSGSVELSGTQTGVLRITGGDITLKNGNFTRTVYLTDTNTTLENTTINTTNNYGLELNSNVNITVDVTSKVKVNSGYASAIIVNEYRNNINMYINGTLESNMQGIGVTEGSTVDNIIIEGTMRNEQNYGLVSTVYGGKINYLEFTESSYTSTPKGLMVYNQVTTGSIGNVIINGYIEEARVILTNGSASTTPTIGTVEFNAYVNKLYDGAFYINGTINSLTFGKNSYINQTTNNYGLIYTNNGTTIGKIDYFGTFVSSYLIVDSYASTKIGTINLDPVDIQTSATVGHNALFWLSGSVDTLLISENVFETETISRAINLQATAVIKEMNIDKSVLDAEVLSASGHIFSNKSGNQIQNLTLTDTLLFGDFIELNIDGISYTHIEPQIEVSNFKVINNVRYIDVEIPNLEGFDNLLEEGVDLMFMRSDYSISSNFKYHGGTMAVEIPEEITSTEDLTITNYAKYNREDQVAISSKRNQVIDLDISQYGINGNDVEYMEESSITIEEYINDAQIIGIGEDFDMDVNLSSVDFTTRGEYQSEVTLTYTDGITVTGNYNVTIIGEDEENNIGNQNNNEDDNDDDYEIDNQENGKPNPDDGNQEPEQGPTNNEETDNQNNANKDNSLNTVQDDANKAEHTPAQAAMSNSVKTSDTTNTAYYIALLVISVGLVSIRKKPKIN